MRKKIEKENAFKMVIVKSDIKNKNAGRKQILNVREKSSEEMC